MTWKTRVTTTNDSGAPVVLIFSFREVNVVDGDDPSATRTIRERIRTVDGDRVMYISKGKYRIDPDFGGFVELSTDDPEAP